MHIETIFCLQVSIGDNHHLLIKMLGDLEIKITTMDHLRDLNGDLEVVKPDGRHCVLDCNHILAVFVKED